MSGPICPVCPASTTFGSRPIVTSTTTAIRPSEPIPGRVPTLPGIGPHAPWAGWVVFRENPPPVPRSTSYLACGFTSSLRALRRQRAHVAGPFDGQVPRTYPSATCHDLAPTKRGFHGPRCGYGSKSGTGGFLIYMAQAIFVTGAVGHLATRPFSTGITVSVGPASQGLSRAGSRPSLLIQPFRCPARADAL
jgi:hypothetical protein